MTLLELITLSIGLAMDATAVSIATSACRSQIKKRYLVKMALAFGIFQAFMPLLGYLAGLTVKQYVMNIDHWIAFILLSVVGGKMIFEHEENKQSAHLSNKKLLILAIATSIDALVVGITLSFQETNLFLDIITIGIITFILSLAGGFLGKGLAHLKTKYLHLAGGLAIIFIGVKILVDHLIAK